MLFNSIHFLIFFPVVVFLYFLVPPKGKLLWLLAASYYFYMSWNPKYILLIAAATVATYMGGRLIEKYHARTTLKKYILMSSIAANLGMLFCFKYFGFAVDNVNRILSKAGICLMQAGHDIILPVGISFFTFQALSYTIDVYRGTVKAEKNILKYALFISFFPQLVAGPIERSGNLLNQIQGIPDRKCWDYDRITSGMIYMLWGVFIKLVIADRLAVMVDQVFAAYSSYGMFELFAGAAAFSFQIYGDFAGYSTIAFGAARILGFELTENFAAPYFSKSIKEFWHRWHITLSTWFRDYVYIPMGGSRRGRRRKYLNLMLTFLASGIWHGAGWTFFVWGGTTARFKYWVKCCSLLESGFCTCSV